MLLPRLGIPSSSSSQYVLSELYTYAFNSLDDLECHLSDTPIPSLPHYSFTLTHPDSLRIILPSYLTQETVLSETTLGAAADGKCYSIMTFPNSATASPLIRVHPLKTASCFVPDRHASTTMTSLPWSLCSPPQLLAVL